MLIINHKIAQTGVQETVIGCGAYHLKGYAYSLMSNKAQREELFFKPVLIKQAYFLPI